MASSANLDGAGVFVPRAGLTGAVVVTVARFFVAGWGVEGEEGAGVEAGAFSLLVVFAGGTLGDFAGGATGTMPLGRVAPLGGGGVIGEVDAGGVGTGRGVGVSGIACPPEDVVRFAGAGDAKAVAGGIRLGGASPIASCIEATRRRVTSVPH